MQKVSRRNLAGLRPVMGKLQNSGADPTENGQLAAILDFCYNSLYMDQLVNVNKNM